MTASAGTSERQGRRARFLRTATSRLASLIFGRVEVYGIDRVPTDGPVLSVANHFGGFIDILLLMAVMPRHPRIIARDVIWKVPLVRSIANWVGAIPVSKPEDRGKVDNDAMFRAAHQALRDGSHVLIFPEGITRDDPSIGRVKTGAARIALGARASGVTGIHIVAAGLHYEDKAALRADASVYVGEPLSLDAEVGAYVGEGERADAENRSAVTKLTADIETRLRGAAPDFENWEEATALTDAAAVFLRAAAGDGPQAQSISARDRLAALAGRSDQTSRDRLAGAMGVYRQDLQALGLTDDELLRSTTAWSTVRRVVANVALALVLLPFAAVGALINVIPFLAVKAAGLIRAAPAVLATVKPMTAILAFGITWSVVGWWALRNFGVETLLAALLLMPVYLATVIVFVDRLSTAWRSLRHWWRRRSRRADHVRAAALADRNAVIDAFRQAL